MIYLQALLAFYLGVSLTWLAFPATRMYGRCALLTPVGWSFTALAYLLAPILPAFAAPYPGLIDNGRDSGVEPRLPRQLSWFMTGDNSLLGDANFKSQHDGGYWSQVRWLQRNPAWGFSRSVLAVTPPKGSPIVTIGDTAVNDGDHGHAGWYLSTTAGAFRFRCVIPTVPGHSFMLDLGWCMPQSGMTDGKPLLFYGVNPRLPRFTAAA